MKGYGPPDPLVPPRSAGVATFLALPTAADLSGVDAGDTPVTPGATAGPKKAAAS